MVDWAVPIPFFSVDNGIHRLRSHPMFIVGFALYTIGFTFLTLFANEHIHGNWCPASKNDTIIDRSHFLNELCVEYLLPTLVIT